MIGFIIGLMLGGVGGMLFTCCCVTAGGADRGMECTENKDEIC